MPVVLDTVYRFAPAHPADLLVLGEGALPDAAFDPMGALAIEAEAAAYLHVPPGPGIPEFYAGFFGNAPAPAAALFRLGAAATLWLPNASVQMAESAADFLLALGTVCANCPPAVGDFLRQKNGGVSTVFHLIAFDAPLPKGAATRSDVDMHLSADDLYTVNLAARPPGSWLADPLHIADTSHRCRHNAAVAAGIRVNGQCVAVGNISAIGIRDALIGGIATLPACQGQGYASAIVLSLVAKALALGKRPLLCCRPALLPFYRRLGFTPIGFTAQWTPG